jgi:hypothetical protein
MGTGSKFVCHSNVWYMIWVVIFLCCKCVLSMDFNLVTWFEENNV